MSARKCSKCNTEKPEDEFALSLVRRIGRQAWCRACMSAYHREYRERRRELRMRARGEL